MAESDDAAVEVVYATAERQQSVRVALEPGLTAADAVERSGLRQRFPEIDARPLVLGIYGKPVDGGHRLCAGDRLEICRPLRVDPRQMRRDLLADGRVMGGADVTGGGAVKK